MISNPKKLKSISMVIIFFVTLFAQFTVNVKATKGSYPGVNGLIDFRDYDPARVCVFIE